MTTSIGLLLRRGPRSVPLDASLATSNNTNCQAPSSPAQVCLQWAQIAREQADRLSWDNPNRIRLIKSTQRWETRARALATTAPPTLDQLRADLSNADWIAALPLLETSTRLMADARHYTEWQPDGGQFRYHNDEALGVRGFHPHTRMNWSAWLHNVESRGRAWSNTEWQLFDRVITLVGANGSIQSPARET